MLEPLYNFFFGYISVSDQFCTVRTYSSTLSSPESSISSQICHNYFINRIKHDFGKMHVSDYDLIKYNILFCQTHGKLKAWTFMLYNLIITRDVWQTVKGSTA